MQRQPSLSDWSECGWRNVLVGLGRRLDWSDVALLHAGHVERVPGHVAAAAAKISKETRVNSFCIMIEMLKIQARYWNRSHLAFSQLEIYIKLMKSI